MVFLRCLDGFVEFVSVDCVFLDVFDGRVVDSEVVEFVLSLYLSFVCWGAPWFSPWFWFCLVCCDAVL